MPQNNPPVSRRPSLRPLLASMILLTIPLACASSPDAGDSKATTRTSDAALNDPYGGWSKVDTNISGGDTKKPDKGGLMDDINRAVWMK